MSEFECENGHQSKAGRRCSVCGGRITRMDGKSNRELRGEEEMAERDRDDESEGDKDNE